MKQIGKYFKTLSGVTLIELLVVVALVGILAGLGIPRFQAMARQRFVQGTQDTLYTFLNAARTYASEHSAEVSGDADWIGSWKDYITSYVPIPAGHQDAAHPNILISGQGPKEVRYFFSASDSELTRIYAYFPHDNRYIYVDWNGNSGSDSGSTTGCRRQEECFVDDQCTLFNCVISEGHGTCVNSINEGANCDSPNQCRLSAHCQNDGGRPVCVPDDDSPIRDCNDHRPCTNDPPCDETLGCVHTDLADGTDCSDQNACTGACTNTEVGCTSGNPTDQCQSGNCIGGGNVSCIDEGNPCTIERCDSSSGCQRSFANAGALCNDRDYCTENDTCSVDGLCAGTRINCDDNNPCTDDACDASTGCTHTNKADGFDCDDGDACNGGHECMSGQCRITGGGVLCRSDNLWCDGPENCRTQDVNGRPTAVCVSGPPPCGDGLCDEAHDRCGCATDADCDDGKYCTGIEHCNNGICVDGTNPCIDDNDCTVDENVCDENTHACYNIPIAGGACRVDCKVGICDMAGQCAFSGYAQDGTPCDDHNACTEGDKCTNGECVSNSVGNCTPCTKNEDCDDHNPCTQNDVCQGGACTGTYLGEGASCAAADQMNCVGAGTCIDGACVRAMSYTCQDEDLNDCKTYQCIQGQGCQGQDLPNGSTCNDGNYCTTGDYCNDGQCKPGSGALNCNDNNPCTADSCNPATGCKNSNVTAGTSCADSNVCNGAEICDGVGHCVSSAAMNCDDSNVCSVDTCDPILGCKHTPRNCDDGNICTTDTCTNPTGCAHTPIPKCTQPSTTIPGP